MKDRSNVKEGRAKQGPRQGDAAIAAAGTAAQDETCPSLREFVSANERQ